MEYFALKLLSIFLVYFFTCSKEIYCQGGESITNDESYFMVENIFGQDSRLKTGDIIECEISKTKPMESSTSDTHVFTQSTTEAGNVFYPVSKDKKCFSFQVRTKVFPHIRLSATPRVVENKKIEVILEYDGNSVIRIEDLTVKIPFKGIVNDKELRGFWIRWLDDQLIEVGRDSDDSPILSYRAPEKLSINFIGIFSHTTTAEWILHKDPHCGIYNTSNKVEAESKCKVGITPKRNSEEINFLQKSQQYILNQMKNKHEIFKGNKLRSKEILLVYQQLIQKLYRNADENQNQIYAEDNENYSPLKTSTFNEISQVYLQFMAELKMELAMFKQTTVEINSPNTILE